MSYREAFNAPRVEPKPRIDYGVLAALVSCLVFWAGFIYLLAKWAGWVA